MNTAIVIEPTPALAQELIARKARARASWPSAPFLNHPPHATLLAGVYETPGHWLPALAQALRSVRPFNIESSAVITFPDDPTPGSTTVAFDIAESKALRALQRVIAETLAPYRVMGAADTLAGLHRRPEAIASARQFGYPWVGPHWRPHFTIGSLPLRADEMAFKEYLTSVPVMHTRVSQVAVWGVAGDDHSTIAQVPLGGG